MKTVFIPIISATIEEGEFTGNIVLRIPGRFGFVFEKNINLHELSRHFLTMNKKEEIRYIPEEMVELNIEGTYKFYKVCVISTEYLPTSKRQYNQFLSNLSFSGITNTPFSEFVEELRENSRVENLLPYLIN